ncbi:Fic/DOC family protein [Aminipila sp.]|uniref:Fic/DOC family protein n=1 Tax=Aminipila sp. TaxID=2060095 RepID=UPI001D7D1DDB|nr:Fic family protein [Aminipila sp.]MBE6033774.1 cell filamentation protein Fic [Clostridiales bacterium]
MDEIYDYSFQNDDKYCYPDSNVLRNKFNIKDLEELHRAERELTAFAIAHYELEPIGGSFDLKHLQKIHKGIFGDIYDWAGEFRTVNISKGTLFCLSQNINDFGNNIFEQLKNENYLLMNKQEHVTERLARYLGEINMLHPFREGNGRAQRMFIQYLAGVCGYDLHFTGVSRREMIEASYSAANCDYSLLESCLEKNITPLSKEEQIEYINKVCTKELRKYILNLI